ncbi:MAG: hypothetical protein NT069_05030, partial [Planctomycetota bacterium]|nr:hypothetical protein [Planctomycetota bacterium]
EVRAWLDSPVGEHPRYLAFRYRATDEDRQHVLEWIQSETDVRRIARMFNLLGSRELPRFDANLLRFCLHPDAEVRRNASRAIGRSQHPTIREFAMGQVDSGITDEAVMELLWQNAEPGDCERLIHVFRLETDDDKRHGQLMNVNGILERCPADEGFPLALIAYRNNPCGYCRWSIVEHLAECELAPEWLIEECRFDAQADTRDAFE